MPELRRPAQSTRAMAAKRRKLAIAIAVGALLIMVLIALLLQGRVLAGLGGATLVLLLLLRVLADVADRETSRLLKAERRALRGASGEEVVGAILSGLGQDYFAIHDLESPYGNIDHIVFARSGSVFMIETKAHHGRVDQANGAMVINGRPPEKDFTAQALRNAAWLGEHLSALVGSKVWVTPILVFANAFVPKILPIRGVAIVNKKFLAAELLARSKGSPASRVWELKAEIAHNLQLPMPRTSGAESRPKSR